MDHHAEMADERKRRPGIRPSYGKLPLGPVLAAVALALVVTAASAAPAWAHRPSACEPFSATAHDAATSPAGPYVGVENVTVGKMTYAEVPAVTTILAPLTPEGESGVLTTTTSHAIALPSATLTTIDRVRLIPTGRAAVYRLVAHLAIVGGATGELQLQGTVDFGTLDAEGTLVGTVCGLG